MTESSANELSRSGFYDVSAPVRHSDADQSEYAAEYIPDEASLEPEIRGWERDAKIFLEVELDRRDRGRQQQNGKPPEDGEVHDAGVTLTARVEFTMTAHAKSSGAEEFSNPIAVRPEFVVFGADAPKPDASV